MAQEQYKVLAIKHDTLGTWCGYIGLPPGHKYHGVDDDEVPVEIHGGWTYARDYAPYGEPDGYWYIGFDCAHAGDRIPMGGLTWQSHTGVYRDLGFVRAELVRALTDLMGFSQYRDTE